MKTATMKSIERTVADVGSYIPSAVPMGGACAALSIRMALMVTSDAQLAINAPPTANANFAMFKVGAANAMTLASQTLLKSKDCAATATTCAVGTSYTIISTISATAGAATIAAVKRMSFVASSARHGIGRVIQNALVPT